MPFTIYLWDLGTGAEKIRVLFKRESSDYDILYSFYKARPRIIKVYDSLKKYIFVRHGNTYFCIGKLNERLLPDVKGKYKRELWIEPSLPAPKEWLMALMFSRSDVRSMKRDVREVKFWRDYFMQLADVDRQETIREMLEIAQRIKDMDLTMAKQLMKQLYESKKTAITYLASAGVVTTEVEGGEEEEEREITSSPQYEVRRGEKERKKPKKFKYGKYVVASSILTSIMIILLGLYHKGYLNVLIKILMGG